MQDQKVKCDLASLFAPPPADVSQPMIMDPNDKLEMVLVLEDKDFVDLPEEEFGHFYTEDCYVFVYRYFIPQEDGASSDDRNHENDDESEQTRLPNGVTNGHTNGDTQYNQDEDYKFVAYFWQGRQASKMGWLTFKFSLQNELEIEFGKLEVVQLHQQQEDLKFLSHFDQRFIIHQGKRLTNPLERPIGLYHLRSNRNPLTLRCIELDLDASKLNSGFCYLVRSLYIASTNGLNNEGGNHISIHSNIFVWVGSKAPVNEIKIAIEIAHERMGFNSHIQSVKIFKEGEEPEEFWKLLGGRADYDTDADFMKHVRLFRCSNDKGYFSITEKVDFCQDDLADDDIMILDNGNQVFLWVGPKSSEVEVKLAVKSAQVYVQNLRLKNPNSRQLMLTLKGKETRKFTKCFHGWSEHKVVKDPRGDEAKFLKLAYQADQEMGLQSTNNQ